MPYIPPDEREHYADALNLLMTRLRQRDYASGHLTYLLYALALRAARLTGSRYQDLSRVRASLQDAADEFYRAVMGPYEEKQRLKNGDV